MTIAAPSMSLPISAIDRSWTLFLDRDGVINRHRPNDYVKNVTEFEMLPGAPEALATLAPIFGRIIVVTNQQGIAKGLYTTQDLNQIHAHMLRALEQAGGRIDRIYFSPHLDKDNSPMRKPGIGMALGAKNDFPEIDFSRSIMVGDSAHDIEFGRRAGMYTMLISTDGASFDPAAGPDATYRSLHAVAEDILRRRPKSEGHRMR